MDYSIQKVYIACRLALIVAIVMGYGTFWSTLWAPIIGIIALPFSTTVYFCAKYIDLPVNTINILVILSIVFEVMWAISVGHRMHLDSLKKAEQVDSDESKA